MENRWNISSYIAFLIFKIRWMRFQAAVRKYDRPLTLR